MPGMKRDKHLDVTVSEAELAEIRAWAEREGLPIAACARRVLLREARKGPIE